MNTAPSIKPPLKISAAINGSLSRAGGAQRSASIETVPMKETGICQVIVFLTSRYNPPARIRRADISPIQPDILPMNIFFMEISGI